MGALSFSVATFHLLQARDDLQGCTAVIHAGPTRKGPGAYICWQVNTHRGVCCMSAVQAWTGMKKCWVVESLGMVGVKEAELALVVSPMIGNASTQSPAW